MLIDTHCTFEMVVRSNMDYAKFVLFYKKLKSTIAEGEGIKITLCVEKKNETPKEKQETTQD